MRFKTELCDIRTFSKLVSSISSLEKIAWVRLNDDTARFTVIPDVGSQVWASISMDLIFSNYTIQSAEPSNTINLEIPLPPLQRALKSAINSTSTTKRLTKKEGIPVLSLTIVTTTTSSTTTTAGTGGATGFLNPAPPPPSTHRNPTRNLNNNLPPISSLTPAQLHAAGLSPNQSPQRPSATAQTLAPAPHFGFELSLRREREKTITQDFPVRVLHPETVDNVMQPTVRDSDVNIQMPSLQQIKAISDRFTRLASSTYSTASSGGGRLVASTSGYSGGSGGGGGMGGMGGGTGAGGGNGTAKLEISATMHGRLNISVTTPTLSLSTTWSGLDNPELDQAQIEVPLSQHPSTVFKAAGPDKWATVRVDGRDLSRVLSVGKLEGSRVVACFSDEHALILYVYVKSFDGEVDESVLTYYISSFSL